MYDREIIDERCVRLAFEIKKKINSQSIAYDFVKDKNGNPLLIEISYGFKSEAYDCCPGYWDKNLNWHEEKFIPQEWMVDDLVNHHKRMV